MGLLERFSPTARYSETPVPYFVREDQSLGKLLLSATILRCLTIDSTDTNCVGWQVPKDVIQKDHLYKMPVDHKRSNSKLVDGHSVARTVNWSTGIKHRLHLHSPLKHKTLKELFPKITKDFHIMMLS